MESLPRKLLSTLVVLALLGGLAGASSQAAFFSRSDNSGQSFSTGTVHLSDNDSNAALFNLSGQKPGTVSERCITVTYGGSLPAEVRLHSDSQIGALGPYLNLTIASGSQTGGGFGDCTGFSPDAGAPLFDGTLAGVRSSHESWATGLSDQGPGSQTSWAQGDSVVYRFSVSVRDNDAARNSSTGSHRYLFEARSG